MLKSLGGGHDSANIVRIGYAVCGFCYGPHASPPWPSNLGVVCMCAISNRILPIYLSTISMFRSTYKELPEIVSK